MPPDSVPAVPPALGRRVAVAVVALAWALQAYALWSRTYVPLVDLPNHVARHALEARWWTGAELPPGYEIHYRLVPNLGGDLVIPPLCLFLDPPTAARVFLTLALFVYWLGPLAFLMRCGVPPTSAVLAALLLLPWGMNSSFFWGFTNFYSGVGLAFLVLAHYLGLQRRERGSAVPGWFVHALLVALLFVWHLAAWGLYGVIMACHLGVTAGGHLRRGERLVPVLAGVLPACLTALPSLVLFLIYSRNNVGVNPNTGVIWGTPAQKALLAGTPFRGYFLPIDLAVLLFWVVAVVACFRLKNLGALGRSWLVVPAAALALLYVVVPYELGSTSAVAVRLLPGLLVCLVGLAAHLPLRRPGLGLLLLAVCLVVRHGSIVYAWDHMAENLDAQAAAFPHLDRGSRVLPIILQAERSARHPDAHFPAWAVSERDIFLPTLFAFPDQQPLVIREPYRSYPAILPEGEESEVYNLDPNELRGRYDFVWVHNTTGKKLNVPPSFERVYTQGALTVWRVR